MVCSFIVVCHWGSGDFYWASQDTKELEGRFFATLWSLYGFFRYLFAWVGAKVRISWERVGGYGDRSSTTPRARGGRLSPSD